MTVGRHAGALALAGAALALAIAMTVIAQPSAPKPPPAVETAPVQPPVGGVVHVDCEKYALIALRIATLRSVEARLELVLAMIRREARAAPAALTAAVEREARAVYAEGLEPEEAQFQAYRRCQAVLGRFGVES